MFPSLLIAANKDSENQTTVYASDNAQVWSLSATDNSSDNLKTSNYNAETFRTFVKFNVAPWLPTVSSAILNIYWWGVWWTWPRSVDIYRVNWWDWDEDNITWANQPSVTSSLWTMLWIPWYEQLDITALYNGWKSWSILNEWIRVWDISVGADIYFYIKNRKTSSKPFITLTP